MRGGAVVLGPRRRSAVPAQEPYASHALRTIPPRENGGNLDVAQVREGSRLLLPVHVPGALLSVGDVHFAQGEGEVCGTAIEVAATVTLEVSLRQSRDAALAVALPGHRVRAAGCAVRARLRSRRWASRSPTRARTESTDATLAARRALLELIGWLEAERGLTREQGYVLASVAADLRVAEAVNVPNPLVTCRLPLDVFEYSSRLPRERRADRLAGGARVRRSADVGRSRLRVAGAGVHSPLDGGPRWPAVPETQSSKQPTGSPRSDWRCRAPRCPAPSRGSPGTGWDEPATDPDSRSAPSRGSPPRPRSGRSARLRTGCWRRSHRAMPGD